MLRLGLFTLFVSFLTASVVEANKVDEKLQQQIIKSQKAIWVCSVLRQKDQEKRIEGLEIDPLNIPVFMMPAGTSMRPLVKLKFTYNRPGWKLFVDKNTPARETMEEHQYLTYAYLNARISEVRLEARNQDGEVQRETVYLFAPKAREYGLVPAEKSISVSVGLGNLIYEQTSFGVFNGRNFMLGLNYMTPDDGSRYGILADFRFSLSTLASEPADYNPQFYEAYALGTYDVAVMKSPRWRSRALAGLSAVGVLAFGSPFGFDNLYGIEGGVRSEYYEDNITSYSVELILTSYDLGNIFSNHGFRSKFIIHKNLASLQELRYEMIVSRRIFNSGFENVVVDLLSLGLGVSL
jgi:hypothetical protein